MNWIGNITAVVTLIGSVAAALTTIVGVVITLSKYHKEANKDRLDLLNTVKVSQETLTCLANDIADIKQQNLVQQEEIESVMNFSRSHFRMSLYTSITRALERGYTNVGEATEITRMFTLYTKHGGNGEIKLLFKKFDKLEIKEYDYDSKQ